MSNEWNFILNGVDEFKPFYVLFSYSNCAIETSTHMMDLKPYLGIVMAKPCKNNNGKVIQSQRLSLQAYKKEGISSMKSVTKDKGYTCCYNEASI